MRRCFFVCLWIIAAVASKAGGEPAKPPELDAEAREALAKICDRPADLAKAAEPVVCILDLQHPEVLCRHVREAKVDQYGGRILRGRIQKITGLPCLLLHQIEIHGKDLEKPQVKAVLITGRSKTFSRQTDEKFHDFLRATRKPVLGFCGGMQLIGQAYAAKVAPLRKLKEGEKDPNPKYHPGLFKEWGFLPVRVTSSDPLFAGLPQTLIVREMHAFQLKETPSEFQTLASSESCAIQVIKHWQRTVYGTQFHPEAYDDSHPHGRILIENFFRLAGIALPTAKP